MGDGGERGYGTGHRHPERRLEQRTAGAGPGGQAPWAAGPPEAEPDEALFAAFMAARDSAMFDRDAGSLSPTTKRRIAGFLLLVFLLSLAAGYAVSRYTDLFLS